MVFDLPAALQRTLALAGRLIPTGGSSGDKAAAPSGRTGAMIERLEPRQLLTTLVGNDTFLFNYTGDVPVRVSLTGNIQAELIGASFDERGRPTLNEVPGTVTGGPRAGTNLFGGFGGADGIAPINTAFPPETASTTDLSGLGFNIGAASPLINLRGLAVNSDAKTYAINSFGTTVGMTTFANYQLVSINRANGNGTVVDSFENQVAATLGVGTDALGPVVTAAFSPDDPNLLYFVAGVRIGGGGANGAMGSVQPFLFTYNLQTRRRPDPVTGVTPNPVTLLGGNFGSAPMRETQVYGITFNDAGDLLAFVQFAAVNGNGGGGQMAASGLVTVGRLNGAINSDALSPLRQVNFGGMALDEVSAITTIPGRDGLVYAVVNGGGVIPAGAGMGGGGGGNGNSLFGDPVTDPAAGDGARLVRIDYTAGGGGTGNALDLGNLPDPGQGGPLRRGENIIGLAWNPKVPNVFRLTDNDPSNDVGSLIATDIGTDELVVLDDRPRFPTTGLYNVVITDSDETGKIAIAEIDPVTGADIPYTGDAGTITITNTAGVTVDITPEADTGSLLLGLRPVQTGPRTTPLIPAIPYNTFTASGGLINDLRIPRMLEPGVRSNGTFGTFMFGGTVTGRVNLQGAANTFYAGQILTGDSGGIGLTDPVSAIDNFAVNGDLRRLVTGASIGTIDPTLGGPSYRTGFQLAVSGKLGHLSTRESLLGTAGVLGSERVSTLQGGQPETEGGGGAAAFEGFSLSDARFSNNTFDTPEYINSFFSSGRRFGEQAQVFGNLSLPGGDGVDYWAMPLLAGQQIEVQFINVGPSPANLGIFDPTGRLVATNYADGADAFHFTPSMPGTYRFAAAFGGDTAFTGDGPSPSSTSYELRLSRIANVSVGGITAGADLVNPDTVPLRAFNGDFGALTAGGNLASTGAVEADAGNFRSLNGGALQGPLLYVPRGSVGMVRATAGLLSVNPGATANGLAQTVLLADGRRVNPAVGGSYQMVDGAGQVIGSYLADGGIGTVRGASMIGGPGIETAFVVDADQAGNDGVIDLIDSGGSLGTGQTGGPIISTGPGGNVRYIRAVGTPFRDPIFGRGTPEVTSFQPGQVARFTDDSGSRITLTPTASLAPTTNPGDPVPLGDTLTVTTYPIRSGGQVIVDVTSTGGLNASENGVAAEIGQVTLNGPGTAVVNDVNPAPTLPLLPGQTADRFAVLDNQVGLPLLDPNATTVPASLNASFSGNGRLDVLRLVGGNFDQITNSTPGEIATVQSDTINRISANTLGFIRPFATETKPEPLALVNQLRPIFGTSLAANFFPFLNSTTGIVANTIAEADTRAGAANFVVGDPVLGGDLGTLRTDTDGKDDPNLWDGIAGPIFSVGTIRRVEIGGQGIAPSGTGNRGDAGLYANGLIGDITNSGLGSDIYGNVVSSSGIRSIKLNDGVINGAQIDVASTLDQSLAFSGVNAPPSASSPITDPQADIRDVTLSGIGGIIGSQFNTQDGGPVSVNGGFGILASSFNGTGDGVQQPISTDGLGVRGTTITGGAVVQNLSARGDGNLLNVNAYAPSARQSGLVRSDATTGNSFDPITGKLLTASNDIYTYTDTTRRKPRQSGKTNAGIIENSTVSASRTLNKVSAYQIQDNMNGPNANATGRNGVNFTRFTVGNNIDNVNVRGAVVGLEVTSGGVGNFTVGRGVFNTDMNIGGRFANLSVGGTVHSDSVFRVFGPNGSVGRIAVNQGWFAPLSASIGIDEFRTGGDFLGRQLGTSPFSAGGVKLLSVGGSVLSGTDVRITDTLRTLFVAGDVERGAFIRAGAIGKQTVLGTVAGLITTV